MSEQRLLALLDGAGAIYRVIPHAPEGDTVAASILRGHPLAQAAKSLVLLARQGSGERMPVLAVIPGDRRVDLAAVKSLTRATSVDFADADTAEELAGSVIGTVTPFIFDDRITLLVDERVVAQPVMVFNAARLDMSLELSTAEYVRIVHPRVEAISE